jgi:hypothetical protein
MAGLLITIAVQLRLALTNNSGFLAFKALKLGKPGSLWNQKSLSNLDSP